MNATDSPLLHEFLHAQMQAHEPPLTAADVVRRAKGLKQPWLSTALAGQYVNPTARTICALVAGVNSTPQDLIGPVCRTEHALRPQPSIRRGRGRKPTHTPQP